MQCSPYSICLSFHIQNSGGGGGGGLTLLIHFTDQQYFSWYWRCYEYNHEMLLRCTTYTIVKFPYRSYKIPEVGGGGEGGYSPCIWVEVCRWRFSNWTQDYKSLHILVFRRKWGEFATHCTLCFISKHNFRYSCMLFTKCVDLRVLSLRCRSV